MAVRFSFALWGGRFNPIIVVDHKKLAGELVERFPVEMIIPLGADELIASFPQRFPYLIDPFFRGLFLRGADGGCRSQILDIHNALVHMR
jgi:hypothetical protein